ncbi:MAG: ATP-dependent RNA helicase [Spirochaetaceae bacterium]|nr:MAG: ATP-dependent RNA helicase [Spirochaetaceae bacterium]
MNYLELPVYKQKEKILDALAANQVIVVESPTGSGKTTQIPKILYDAGYAKSGMIGVTQPRRIAAVSVTEYIAGQLGKKIPDTVGYKMRFHDITDERTKIKIMTDGTLLQEIKADYDLSKYSIIMVDEAHERSLNIDFILGLLKRILERRSDFKVIISSATINPEVFQVFFEGCPIVNIDTSMYPVDIRYTPPKPENDYDAMIFQIADIVADYTGRTPEGDILIFLSGEKPIKDATRTIEALPGRQNLEILPLYARLSSEEQERVFLEYPGKRKIIIATNIAETSITIDGVTLVIDSGLAKVNYYNPHTFTSSLVEMPISRAAAKQRRGRAGRTRPGECHRLYSKQDYEHRPLYTTEEILRTDLSEVVLRMAEIKIRDFENFEFISPPPPHGLSSAVDTLYMLDALDANRDLSATGKMMAEFPLLPKHSRIIVEAILRYPNVIEEILIASSFLTVNTPFLLPQGQEIEARKAHHFFRHPLGDFVSYLKMYRTYSAARDKDSFCESHFLDKKVMDEILNVKTQLEEIVSNLGVPVLSGGGLADYLCAIARGLIQFVCVRMGRSLFRSITAAKIQIHPGSVMYGKEPQYIVAGEVVRTSRMYARSVSVIEEAWLSKIHPNLRADLARKHRGYEGSGISGGEARDFTNQIKIGNEIFKIIRVKGKKIVQLPWEQIARLYPVKNGNALPGWHSADYKKLHGTVIYDNHEIMHGVKLYTILEVIPRIKMDRGILSDWPRHKNMIMPHHKTQLLGMLENLMHLCRRKKHEKDLGFLSLTGDNAGTYWFISEKSFYAALSANLASLENLADEPAGVFTEQDINDINRTFRKLSELMEK